MEKITSLTDFIEKNKELTKGSTLYGKMIDSFFRVNSPIKQNDIYSKTFILREFERILDWEENRGYVGMLDVFPELDQIESKFQECVLDKSIFSGKDKNVSRVILTRTNDFTKRLRLSIHVNEFLQEYLGTPGYIVSLDREKKQELNNMINRILDDSSYNESDKKLLRIIQKRLCSDNCSYERMNGDEISEYDCLSLHLKVRGRSELISKAALELYLECRATVSPFQFFYRGESSVNWRLLPSILRHETSWSKESFYYHEMLVRCPGEFKDSSFLNKLVTMQHYGCPTRLLDVTLNSLIGLYFACESNYCEDGKVYIFPTIRGFMSYADSEMVLFLSCLPHLSLNEQKNLQQELKSFAEHNEPSYLPLWTRDKLLSIAKKEKPSLLDISNFGDLMSPLFVQPDYTNDRIRNQQGAFIISGVFESLDEAESRLKARTANTSFIIEAGAKKKILDELDSVGVNKATVYPNVEKIAEYLKSL